jgi:uncharacterized protein (DUF2249 family)
MSAAGRAAGDGFWGDKGDRRLAMLVIQITVGPLKGVDAKRAWWWAPHKMGAAGKEASGVKRLDVRPILTAGGEPFEDIMGFVNRLEAGESFELLATFRPDPLIGLLAGRGYRAEPEEWPDGTWCVTFRPQGA